MQNFGVNRVLEPVCSIPVSAWKLDNSPMVSEHEMRIQVKKIKLEEASFQQMCNECGYDERKIREKILDIVKKRGKLHNPSTDSGGMLYGVIEEIGTHFEKKQLYHVNDKVMCITSLTAIPLFLSDIGKIDFRYSQVDVDGYAIVFETSPLVPCPGDLNICHTMSALDESGSVLRVFQLAVRKKRFLILGSDLLPVLLYSSAIQKAVGRDCRIVAVLDNKNMQRREETCEILRNYIDEVYFLDILTPLKSFELIEQKEKELFDFSINCADLLGAEAISVLLTENQGCIFFTSLINNYNLAILFAESLGKELKTYSLDEYTNNYAKFTIDLIREIKADLERMDLIDKSHPAARRLPATASELLKYKEVGKIDDFVFLSDVTRTMVEEVLNIAEYDCNVIIQGETGVGKEKVLSLIHKNSTRKFNACIKINCATIQENLAESEFFGYEAGAFTGANPGGKPGYFELANNGILFLDEVEELPLSLQSKLLRVLQENQFYRIGGVNQVNVNVRVICASNVDLQQLIEQGKFREDLYFRLNIYEIYIPPLRERPEDIFCLAQSFLGKYNERYHRAKQLDKSALEVLLECQWQGNVRELENTIHRAVINTKTERIESGDICGIINRMTSYGKELHSGADLGAKAKDLETMIGYQEKVIIEETLKREKTTRRAAEVLGISQSQLMRKKQKYQIEY
jgi:transcriptional regulator with PAS, ATPase and Fis domain